MVIRAESEIAADRLCLQRLIAQRRLLTVFAISNLALDINARDLVQKPINPDSAARKHLRQAKSMDTVREGISP